MNTFSLLFQVAIAVVAVNCQHYVGPVSQISEQQSNSDASANAYASSQSSNSQYSNAGNLVGGPMAGPIAGPMAGPLVGPIAGNPRIHTQYAAQSIHANKGEILIHRPAPIIVKRPPTKVLVHHAPLYVKPAPVVLHKPPPVVVRKVFIRQHPRPVKVEPVYVNVVKPAAEKYFVNEKTHRVPVGYAHPHVHPHAIYNGHIQDIQSQSNSHSQASAQAQSSGQSQVHQQQIQGY